VAGHLTSAQPLVVEFVGLPGVGKSHATRLVAARLAAVGTPARSSALRINYELGRWRRVLYKSGICVAEALGRPGRAARVGRALIGSGQQSRVDVVRFLYNWLFLAGLLRRARTRPRPAVELLDEGIYQLLWSIGFAGGERVIRDCSSTFLKGPAPAVPMPDVVVVVEAPLGLIQARLASRKSRAGRLDRMEAAERQAALVRGADLLTELLSENLGPGGEVSGPLLRRVRNGGPSELDADVAALVDELASLAE
jgi:hypothetical protein